MGDYRLSVGSMLHVLVALIVLCSPVLIWYPCTHHMKDTWSSQKESSSRTLRCTQRHVGQLLEWVLRFVQVQLSYHHKLTGLHPKLTWTCLNTHSQELFSENHSNENSNHFCPENCIMTIPEAHASIFRPNQTVTSISQIMAEQHLSYQNGSGNEIWRHVLLTPVHWLVHMTFSFSSLFSSHSGPTPSHSSSPPSHPFNTTLLPILSSFSLLFFNL